MVNLFNLEKQYKKLSKKINKKVKNRVIKNLKW